MDILLTWVGARDPGWNNQRTGSFEPGPVYSLLLNRHFDVVYLLFNLDSEIDDFTKRATELLRVCQRNLSSVQIRQKPLEVISVTDYRELFRVMNNTCLQILKEEGQEGHEYFVYLSPGTPQMQTIWVLLVQSGLLPARMITATPPDLVAPGLPIWHEVELTLTNFPQIISPGETSRQVGILQTQNDNLVMENRRLRAQIDVLRIGVQVPDDGSIRAGFQLRDYLDIQERALYVRALEQAGNNAAEAARLLGVAPHTFRDRAAKLGARDRRQR